jgi:hypothetical protein
VRITLLAAPRQETPPMRTITHQQNVKHSTSHARTTPRTPRFITTLQALLAATTLTATLTATSKAHAQTQPLYTSAGLISYATVIQPLSINAFHNLEFGTVFVGFPKTISPTTASAGQFQIHGQSDATIAVTFSMPSALTLTSDNVTELPIGDWTYATSPTSSTVTGTATPGTPITQGAPMNFVLPTQANGPALMSLGIGATVTPSASQTTGDYLGLGNIDIAYTDY